MQEVFTKRSIDWKKIKYSRLLQNISDCYKIFQIAIKYSRLVNTLIIRRGPPLQFLRLLVHLSVLFLVLLWTFPTAGLLISSFRDKDQLAVSGWWQALSSSEQNKIGRTKDPDQQVLLDGQYVLTGQIDDFDTNDEILRFGWTSKLPEAYLVGDIAEMRNGGTLTVSNDGLYNHDIFNSLLKEVAAKESFIQKWLRLNFHWITMKKS